MKNELVSIITPSYNTANYIGQTIESVLNQTYINWEMIIVDDCSIDDTDEIVSKYLSDKRIRYLKNKHNSGAAVSRNYALQKANGKWIAFLDSDDLWHPNKLEKQIQFMEKNNYHFSYTQYQEIEEDNKPKGRMISGPKKITKSKMYAYCWPGCLTVMYDAEKVGLIQIEDIKKNNDYAMWLQIIEKVDCYYLDEMLSSYRIREGSISNQNYFQLLKWHYKLFKIAGKKSCFFSCFYTIENMIFGIYKKIHYRNKVIK